jgi:hypothetical protein
MPNIKDLFEVYRPKPKDEQEFVDKHVVIKHKDANGNGDDVFNASNVKKVDRKKTRMGYDVPEDEKVYEETDLEESLGMGYKPTSEKSKFGPGHRAKLMNPEGRLSYLSQKAYKTAKHAKAAAEFYHSIGRLPTQTIDNKMSQYNKAYDAKHKMDEAFELDKDQIANSILEMAEVEGVELTKQELNHLVNKLVEAADEDTAEKTEMAQTQLHFIGYAVKEILDFVKMGGEVEEWYQNKLSKVHSDIESLHSYVEGEKRRTGMVKESEELDEVLTAKTPMKTYIRDFQKSDAPQFKGKSQEKRRQMAIAAKLSAERGPQKEEVEQIDEIQKSYGQSKGPVLKTSKGTFTAITTSHDPYRYHIIQTSDSEGNKFTKKNSPTQHLNVGNLEKVKAKFEQMKEEIELDEVFDTPKGKEVARAYIKRASTNAFSKGFTGGSMLNRQIEDPASREQEQKGGEKAVKTGLKRLVGIGRATDRLTKEDIDQIDEISSELATSFLQKKRERDYDTSADGTYSKMKKPQPLDRIHRDIKSTVRALRTIEKSKKTNEEVEAEVPFEGPYRKPGTRKDEYGNKIKNVPRHLTKEDIINNAIDKFVPEEAKYSVDERFAMRLENVPELHRSALTKLFNGLTEANRKVMLNQLSEEAGLQKLINFVIENRND